MILLTAFCLGCCNELSCYGIRNVGGAAYVTRIPGYAKAAAPPETARSSFAAVSEVRSMVWKLPGDRISRYTLL